MVTTIETSSSTQTLIGKGVRIMTIDEATELHLGDVINFRREPDHGVALTMRGEIKVPMSACPRLRGEFSV